MSKVLHWFEKLNKNQKIRGPPLAWPFFKSLYLFRSFLIFLGQLRPLFMGHFIYSRLNQAYWFRNPASHFQVFIRVFPAGPTTGRCRTRTTPKPGVRSVGFIRRRPTPHPSRIRPIRVRIRIIRSTFPAATSRSTRSHPPFRWASTTSCSCSCAKLLSWNQSKNEALRRLWCLTVILNDEVSSVSSWSRGLGLKKYATSKRFSIEPADLNCVLHQNNNGRK